MRLIDADALKEKSYRTEFAIPVVDVEDIDNAPTVEEQPQGEWIKNPKTFCWECSKCHEVPTKYTDWNVSEEQLKDYRFCRWCGAKMKGGAE